MNGFEPTTWTTNTTDQVAGNSRYGKGCRANSGLRAEERGMVALGGGIPIPWDDRKNFNVIDDRKDGFSAASQFRALNFSDVAWASGSGEDLNQLRDFHIPTSPECEGVTEKMVEGLRGSLSRQLEIVSAGEKTVNVLRGLEHLRKEVGPAREESYSTVREGEHMNQITYISRFHIPIHLFGI